MWKKLESQDHTWVIIYIAVINQWHNNLGLFHFVQIHVLPLVLLHLFVLFKSDKSSLAAWELKCGKLPQVWGPGDTKNGKICPFRIFGTLLDLCPLRDALFLSSSPPKWCHQAHHHEYRHIIASATYLEVLHLLSFLFYRTSCFHPQHEWRSHPATFALVHPLPGMKLSKVDPTSHDLHHHLQNRQYNCIASMSI